MAQTSAIYLYTRMCFTHLCTAHMRTAVHETYVVHEYVVHVCRTCRMLLSSSTAGGSLHTHPHPLPLHALLASTRVPSALARFDGIQHGVH